MERRFLEGPERVASPDFDFTPPTSKATVPGNLCEP